MEMSCLVPSVQARPLLIATAVSETTGSLLAAFLVMALVPLPMADVTVEVVLWA